jgi:hypothetical protein
VIAASALLGCSNSDNETPTAKTIPLAERPALEILLVDCEAVAERIELRWRAASEQPIQCRAISSDRLMQSLREGERINADVILFPNYLIGEMVESETVTRLPSQLAALGDASSSLEVDIETQWPPHWRRNSRYGEDVYGVPLGAPLLAWISSGETGAGISESDAAGSEIDNESASDTGQSEDLDRRDSQFLLDQFAMLLATQYRQVSQTGTLFRLATMSPDLRSPEVIAAVSQLKEISTTFPKSVAYDPSVVWTTVGAAPLDNPTGQSGFGWPGTDSSSDLQSQAFNATFPIFDADWKDWTEMAMAGRISPTKYRIFDSGRGLLASLSRTTRQSNTATQFLKWIDDDQQRSDLMNDDARIQPRPDVLLSSSTSLVNRNRYFTMLVAAWEGSFIQYELRNAGAYRMRQSLAESLDRIVREDVDIADELAKCSQQWQTIIDEYGNENLRRSIERSLGITM